MAIEIPKQLQKREFRFTKVNEKIPYEKEWSTKNNYEYNDPNLIKHINSGGNIGIIGGFGSLIVIDCDSQEAVEATKDLPQTFTVASANKKLPHKYYFCPEIEKSFQVKDVFKGHLTNIQMLKKGYTAKRNNTGEITSYFRVIADIISGGKQAVCPGSILLNSKKYEIIKDLPIAEVSAGVIHAAFIKWKDKPKIQSTEYDRIPESEKPNVTSVFESYGYDTSKTAIRCMFHDDKKPSLGINKEKNFWNCFTCGAKGDAFSFVMLKEDCDFITAKKILIEKGLLKPDAITSDFHTKKAVGSFYGMLDMANRFIKIQPLYYDTSKLWWIWNFKMNCWQIVDETDLMNIIDKEVDVTNSVQSKTKTEILEALKRKARLNKPQELKSSWIQFKDKIVDIKTGKEFEATPDYFATNPIPWELGESEETPIMDSLFNDWVGEKYSKMLYEVVAFCLPPNYFIHRILCLIGVGLNGKSTFLQLLEKFIGNKNVTSTELDDLSSSRFEKAKLYKKLVCLMGESNYGTLKRTSLLKKLTGRDLINFEFKNKDPFDDYNYAKIIIATNTLPQTTDKTKGFYRRWSVIDFCNEFEEKPILHTIPEQEYNNLARKCVSILKRLWETRKFTSEGNLDERTKKYEDLSNPLTLFIQENCVRDMDSDIPFFEFYETFHSFLHTNGYRLMTNNEVGRQLTNNGFEKKRKNYKKSTGENSSMYFIVGLKFKDNNDNNDNNNIPIRKLHKESKSNLSKNVINVIINKKLSDYKKVTNDENEVNKRILSYVNANKGLKITKYDIINELNEEFNEEEIIKSIEELSQEQKIHNGGNSGIILLNKRGE